MVKDSDSARLLDVTLLAPGSMDCMWLCDKWLTSPSKAKISNLIVEKIDKTYLISEAIATNLMLYQLVLLKMFQKTVTDSLPSYRDALQKDSTQINQLINLQFLITDVPEN